MVSQETIALSNPSLETGSVAFTQSIQDGKKKQQEELLRLGAILQLVEKEVAEAKSGTTTAKSGSAEEGKIIGLQAGNTGQAQGPSGTKFEDTMASMALALQMLQVLIAKYGNKKSNQESKISNAQVQATKENLENLQAQLKKIQQKKDKQKTISTVEKIIEGVIGVITVIIGAVLFQPELMVMGLMSMMSATGVFKMATDGIAKLLEKAGVSKEAANIVAAIIVFVIVVVASVMAMDPEESLDEGAEATTEIAEDVGTAGEEAAATAAEGAGEATEEASNTAFQSVKNLIKLITKASKDLGPRIRMGLFSTMTMLSNTQLIQKSYDAAAKGAGVSKAQREKVEQDIGIGVGIATFLVTLFTGAGAASGASTAADLSAQTASLLTNVQKITLGIGSAGELVTGLYGSAITIQEGELQAALAKNQAAIQTLSTLSQIITTETQESQKAQASAEKSQQTGDKALGDLMNGLKGFANAFQYSPV